MKTDMSPEKAVTLFAILLLTAGISFGFALGVCITTVRLLWALLQGTICG